MHHPNPLDIAVHGATGVQGAAIVRRLLRDGHHVRAVARYREQSPELPRGCEPVVAGLGDAQALARAYAGADAVVVQLPGTFDETALRQAEHLAEALLSSRVPRVVFNTSGPSPSEPVGIPYIDARLVLREALECGTFDLTVVGPMGPYMENLVAPWSAPLVRDGILAYPLPAEAPVPWVALADLAEQIAAAIGGDVSQPVLVCGPRPLTGDEAAAALGRGLGRPLEWKTIEPREFGEMMRPYTGDEFADGIAGLYAAMAAGPPPPAPDPALVRAGQTELEAWARGQAWDRHELLAATG